MIIDSPELEEQPAVFRPTPDEREAAQRVMARCAALGAVSAMEGGVFRSYLTPEHAQCNAIVGEWMREAGLAVWQDAAGNICGRMSGEGEGPRKTLLLASHLDTIRNAGRYDGILGVLVAVEGLDRLRKAGVSLPFDVDVIGFGDEEGARFGTTLLGSRAVAGTWQSDWSELEDANGVTLGQAMTDFGLNPAAVGEASRQGDDLLAYIEVHIEQGPVLEKNNQPLGVVPSIAGARRFKVRIIGRAGHAGTVPMDMRQDALVAAASAVQMVERIAGRFEIVATVGELRCYPGAPNVIPGDCEFTVDIRAGRDMTRDLAVTTLMEEIDNLVAERGLVTGWEETHSAPAVACASWLQRVLEGSVQDLGLEPLSIVSGAGHDAMSLAAVTDVGMLFVRCAGGISHHPAESVEADDVAASLAALDNALRALASTAPGNNDEDKEPCATS